MGGATTAIGILAVTAALATGMAAVSAASVRAAHAAATADNAALAAADTALGFAAGTPCERAADIATRAGLLVAACDVTGVTVAVDVTGPAGVFRVHARARAGPPPAYSG